MGPYRLLAAFDLHLDRIVDVDEGLDVWEEAGADKDFTTTSLGLQALRHVGSKLSLREVLLKCSLCMIVQYHTKGRNPKDYS